MSTETNSTLTTDERLKLGILKAADFIDAHPKQFDFGTVEVPHTCDSPGCALGWIHFFSKIEGVYCKNGESVIEAEYLFGDGVWDQTFYNRMTELVGTPRWRDDAYRSLHQTQVFNMPSSLSRSPRLCRSPQEETPMNDDRTKDEKAYTFEWQHGPAPGLTFYSGSETAYGPNVQIAMQRAKRMICQRGCFQPACITMKSVSFKPHD